MRLLLFVSGLAALTAANDPEILMSTPEIIEYWGYVAELYPVTTPDGYILEMHRIPFGKQGDDGKKKPVIFLQHGLECDSSNWVVNLPSESAAFMFADNGFDVWMGNMRGNTYGKQHTSLTSNEEKFWEFSWDEMVTYDLDTMINKVLEVTNSTSLYYVGHSQGTLTMFSKLSTDQAFASKIRHFFALAPIGTVKHIKGLIKFAADFLLPEFDLWVDVFGSGEFLPNNWIMKVIAEAVCTNFIGNPLCDNVMFLIAGPESSQFNNSRAAVYTGHTPAGTSTRNIVHWAQMVKRGTVAMYDYGSDKQNENHYGQKTPPSYDFTKVNAPVHLFWSDDDWLGDKNDIEEFLIPNLPLKFVVENNHLSEFNHLDFIWGLRATAEIYIPIIKTVQADFAASQQQH